MALKCSRIVNNYEFKDAYFKVNFVEITNGLILFVAEIFPNETLRHENRCLLQTYVNMVPNINDDADYVRAVYTFLKTLPEFADAVDV